MIQLRIQTAPNAQIQSIFSTLYLYDESTYP